MESSWKDARRPADFFSRGAGLEFEGEGLFARGLVDRGARLSQQ